MSPSPSPRSRPMAYPPKARARRVPGVMNGLESAYAAYLDERKAAGEIEHYEFEKLTLRLAKALSVTIDFTVYTSDGYVELHETKGFMRDDAWAKLKMAAAMFPRFTIRLVKKRPKKAGGGWDIKEVPAQ